MGLDQYLIKKTYVHNWSFMSPNELHTITVKKGGKKRKDIKPERISYIIETFATWRKFNALHNWFVNNVQNGNDDCKEYYVSNEKLEILLSLLKEIIKFKPSKNQKLSVEDLDKVNTLFPTAAGFFFGGTQYDDYYFYCIEETINILEEIIKEDNGDFYYHSSW